MERLVSSLEALFRPRDNYTTGARTAAFLLAAAAVALIEKAIDGNMNPWVIALLVAGLLNLFALLFNIARSRRERPIVLLTKTREQLEELSTSLENYFDIQESSRSRPDAFAALTISLARSRSMFQQLDMPPLPNFGESDEEDDPYPLRRAVFFGIRECDDRVVKLENRPSWWKGAGSFSLRS